MIDWSSWELGKSKTLSFPTHNEIVTEYFDLIQTDVQGIAPAILHSHYVLCHTCR